VRTHRHIIQFPIFSGYKIHVVFTSDIAAAVKRVTKAEAPPDCAAWTVQDSEGFSTIILSHHPNAEVVAHESFHAIYALMKWAGAALEEEVVAYHLGHVVGLITKWSRKYEKNT